MIDSGALAGFIRERVAPFSGDLALRRVEGGQSNPTWIVRAGADKYVLRTKPAGTLLPSAHAIEREFRVMQALQASAVPVPRVRALCEDTAVLGVAFYLMDFVEGRILTDQTLPGMAPDARRTHYAEMNRIIAELHGIDWRAAGLHDYGREGRYLERQIERWTRQYRASATQPIAAMDALIDWLPAHVPSAVPEQPVTSLVHGDYRLDNLVFHATEPRIVAVLDWELSTLGDPLVDLAYHCMTWRIALGTHRTLAGVDLAPLGIPTEDEHVAAYCARRGVGQGGRIPNWSFYLAFNMFRMAAIQQGVARRALGGNAANSRAAAVAERAAATAAAGWQLAQQVDHAVAA